MTVRGRLQQRTACALSLCFALAGMQCPEEALAAPTVSAPLVNPGAMTISSSKNVLVTVRISDPTLIVNSVQLLQVNESNVVVVRLGGLTDDGLNNDLLANDKVFTKQVTLVAPSSPGKIRLRVSAAFTGLLQRIMSDVTVIDITPVGIPTDLQGADPSKMVIDPATDSGFVRNEFIASFLEGTSLDEINTAIASIPGTLIGRLPAVNLWQIKFPGDGTLTAVENAINVLKASGKVESADPNFVVSADSHAGDPENFFSESLINLFSAQLQSLGAGQTIAILDSGVDLLGRANEELKSNQKLGPVYPVDTADPPMQDLNGHGTHVDGIVQLVAPASARRVTKHSTCTSEPGKAFGSVADLARAIDEAVVAGVQIISISSSLQEDVNRLKSATLAAQKAGVLIVASAGNQGSADKRYPAAYPGVVSVGNVDATVGGVVPLAKRAGDTIDTNWGKWIRIYAPGVDIKSTYPDKVLSNGCYHPLRPPEPNGLQILSGTSQATPIVSGAAALVLDTSPSLKSKPIAVGNVLAQSAIVAMADFNGNPTLTPAPENNVVCYLDVKRAISVGMLLSRDPAAMNNRTDCGGPFVVLTHPGGTSSVTISLSIDDGAFFPVTLGANASTVVYLTNPLSLINPLTVADPKSLPALLKGAHKLSLFLNVPFGSFVVSGYRLTLSPGGHRFTPDGVNQVVGLLNNAIRAATYFFVIE